MNTTETIIEIRPARVVVAEDRDESDPCERGTIGCSVDHTNSRPGSSCETW